MIKTAFISVWDKTGLIPLAAQLKEHGWNLIASGGTARQLIEGGLQVTPVREVTGEPELFGGRVKTLHPAIHAGILAPDTEEARSTLRDRGWPLIDLIVVNLYPFQDIINDPETTPTRAIEYIDIGGAALLRAGAKNYQRVAVLSDPRDYPRDLAVLEDPGYRKEMAWKSFAVTAAYDTAIASYFHQSTGAKGIKTHVLFPSQQLRYGENPHQKAAFYADRPGGTPFHGKLLQGKPLSYNNLLDLESAWRSVRRFEKPAAVVVKHASPCGVAQAGSAAKALSLAVASDPISAFGSVIACNHAVDAAFVKALGDLFLECLIAPDISEGAHQQLAGNKNLRLIQAPIDKPLPRTEMRSLPGGYLEQETDPGDPEPGPAWEVVTERQPTPEEVSALQFAWKAVMDVKSNAVLLAKTEGEMCFTVGIGGGQPNRVGCLRTAGFRAGKAAAGSVLASDAFFPFPDGIQLAAELGVSAVVQPGGSRNDPQVIAEADQHEIAMVFTSLRHFRH